MCEVTRREWLGQCLSAAGAVFVVQLPAQFSSPATPPCDPATTPTPARPVAGFRPGAPVTRTIGTPRPGALAVGLSGAVIGLRCGLIAKATVDFWVGDARGRQQTDADGRYHATVIVPRPTTPTGAGGAPRVNLRVQVPGKATLTTCLFLPDEIARAQNAADPRFDELLRMKLVGQTKDAIDASFNVILDL